MRFQVAAAGVYTCSTGTFFHCAFFSSGEIQSSSWKKKSAYSIVLPKLVIIEQLLSEPMYKSCEYNDAILNMYLFHICILLSTTYINWVSRYSGKASTDQIHRSHTSSRSSDARAVVGLLKSDSSSGEDYLRW